MRTPTYEEAIDAAARAWLAAEEIARTDQPAAA